MNLWCFWGDVCLGVHVPCPDERLVLVGVPCVWVYTWRTLMNVCCLLGSHGFGSTLDIPWWTSGACFGCRVFGCTRDIHWWMYSVCLIGSRVSAWLYTWRTRSIPWWTPGACWGAVCLGVGLHVAYTDENYVFNEIKFGACTGRVTLLFPSRPIIYFR